MSIRKHGPSWQVRIPGERPKCLPTRAAAEKYERSRKLARSLGELHDEESITIVEMLDGHLQRWQARTQPAKGSIDRAEDALKFWRREFPTTLLSQARLAEIEDAVYDRAVGHPNSAKKELEWFKRGLRDARRRGQRFDLALLMIDPIRAVSREGIALDVDELQRLGSWFPEHLARMPEIVGFTAMRIGEALTLEKDRVSVKRGNAWIYIPAALCKERRDKRIELAEFERELLAEHLLELPAGSGQTVFPKPRGGPYDVHSYFYEAVWHPAREAMAREWRDEQLLSAWDPCRYDELVPHDLRHTGISLMARAGMKPETIANRVGHKDGGVLILRRYRHLFPGETTEALAQFETFLRQRREEKREAVEVGS